MFAGRRALGQLPRSFIRKAYSTSTNGSNDGKNTSLIGNILTYGSGFAIGWFYRSWYMKDKLIISVNDPNYHIPPNQDDAPQLSTSRSPVELCPPSDEHVTRRLNRSAYSNKVKGINGVREYHGAQIQSSSSCEDHVLHGKFSSPSQGDGDWIAWGVFDGHAGWMIAYIISRHLLSYVVQALPAVMSSSSSTLSDDISAALKAAFLSLDSDLINPAPETLRSSLPFPQKAALLVPPNSGSCALLALYAPTIRTLYTACVGDSRAVFGQLSAPGAWETIPLSTSQTTSNASELTRLHAAHPNEPDMISDNGLHGIMVTRAFGDAQLKWDVGTQEEVEARFNGRKAKALKTPPYLTAEPEVTVRIVEEGKKGFLILASDGFWNRVSDEQAVGLMGSWIEWDAAGRPKQVEEVEEFGEYDSEKDRNGMYKFEKRRTALRDENAAVHLIRNAMGGRFVDMLHGNFLYVSPLVKKMWDDVTVQVVFFD